MCGCVWWVGLWGIDTDLKFVREVILYLLKKYTVKGKLWLQNPRDVEKRCRSTALDKICHDITEIAQTTVN